MALLLRFAALAVLLVLGRQRKARATELIRRVERLPWSRRAEFVWRVATDRRVPLLGRAAVLIPAVYLISPIDLLPDFLPFLGRLDDSAISTISMDLLSRFTPEDVMLEHLNALEPRRAGGARTTSHAV